MNKKEFELIADVIDIARHDFDRTAIEDEAQAILNTFAGHMANTLAEAYPKFNKDKFLKACGLGA